MVIHFGPGGGVWIFRIDTWGTCITSTDRKGVNPKHLSEDLHAWYINTFT